MAASYKRLFHLLIERDMTTTQLLRRVELSANIVPRIKQNGYISLDTIKRTCRALGCRVDDILEFAPDNPEELKRCDLRTETQFPYSLLFSLSKITLQNVKTAAAEDLYFWEASI